VSFLGWGLEGGRKPRVGVLEPPSLFQISFSPGFVEPGPRVNTESTEIVVVGAGPCGAVAAATLAAAGLSVIVLEAGPTVDSLPNTEANAGRILWTGPRTFVGPDGVMPKMGTGVGGGSLAWLGVVPRFQRHDFHTRTLDSYGDDWPIGYDDLRPYYTRVERDFGVAGESGLVRSSSTRCRCPRTG